MTGWLLDTSVTSELRRARSEPRVMAFVAAQPLARLFVSVVVTFAERRFGIEPSPPPIRRAELHEWLLRKVRPMVGHRVLPVREWRLPVEEGRGTGRSFSQPDLFIAATALHHGLTVV